MGTWDGDLTDSANLKIYVNEAGTSFSDTAVTAAATGSLDYNSQENILAIGGRSSYSPGDYQDGKLDEVCMYSKALSTAEIETLFGDGTPQTAGNSADISSLIAFWRFEEGTGSTAADSSGNGLDATLTDAPTWGTH